jgi:hypothetical protein
VRLVDNRREPPQVQTPRAHHEPFPLPLAIAWAALCFGLCVLVGLLPIVIFELALLWVAVCGCASTAINRVLGPARSLLLVTHTAMIFAALAFTGWVLYVVIGGVE